MTASANVPDFLLSGKKAEAVALRLLRSDHTYGQLQSAVAAVARYLLQLGAKKGDRVILIGENSLFWVAGYLGAMRAGLVAVPLPVDLATDELAGVLETAGARAAMLQAGHVMRNPGCFAGLHLITDRETPAVPGALSQTSFSELQNTGAAPCPFPESERGDLAALMFTSGSTGKPRAVMVTHGNIIANTESIIEYLELTERDRIMDVLPFHYCFGASLLHTHLRVGGTVVVESRFLYPEAVLQRMAETECTGFAGVPSHFQILLHGSGLRKRSFPHLRYVQQAGGRLPPESISELRAALPGARVFVMYGQTEATARLSYLPPEYVDAKPGSIGRGIPGVRLRVVNEAGESVLAGETGEIVAEGENVARGYWRAPEESEGTFRRGLLYTGDLATVDEEGFIYITGRSRDFIKCGGERVSCARMEEKLLAFEDVIEAAVTSVPDEVLGEAVRAYAVLRKPACGEVCDWRACRGARERLRLFCKRQMPPPVVPKEIVLLPALPRNGAGKVLKPRLTSL